MAIRTSFKRGVRQSQQAADYFKGVVDVLIHEIVAGLEEHCYSITSIKGPSLRLHVWSSSVLSKEELHDLMELLMTLRTEVDALQEDRLARQHVSDLAAGWLRDRFNGADLYVELAVLDNLGERPEFTLALMHGRCAMFSTNECLFSWLDQDIFGLTLAGQGSFLLEIIPEKTEAPRWRQAS